MFRSLPLLAGIALMLTGASARAAEGDNVKGPLDFKMKDIKGKELDLSQYKGKVVLLVNVASRCGYTPQYRGLEKLYEDYKDKGLVVIGIPANEFGKQEPGSNEQILEFCETNYKVTFPLLSKVVVKGEGMVPLYEYLTSKKNNPEHGGDIQWNFTKFLVGRDGQVKARFEPAVKPDSEEMVGVVQKELEKKQ
jgi:glutathione peroxidase